MHRTCKEFVPKEHFPDVCARCGATKDEHPVWPVTEPTR